MARCHKNCSNNLCVCGKSKKEHFKNTFECVYKASFNKNVIPQHEMSPDEKIEQRAIREIKNASK